jgi:hypothetical protein
MVNPEGLPHMTLITALQAKTPTHLIWCQFSEGKSKENVKGNPRTGFLTMTLDRRLWRGKAVWTHELRNGEDFDMFNHGNFPAYVQPVSLIESFGIAIFTAVERFRRGIYPSR